MVRTIQSRGPWLASGLCCPARSSLTMASSETLGPPSGLFASSWRVFTLRSSMGSNREAPQFTLYIFLSVPSSVPRRTIRLLMIVPSPYALVFTTFAKVRHSHCHHHRFPDGRVTRLQYSLNATARRVARPSPTRAFTHELSPPQVASKRRRV